MRELWIDFLRFFFDNAGTILIVIAVLFVGILIGGAISDMRAKKRKIWYIGKGGLYQKKHWNDDSDRLR